MNAKYILAALALVFLTAALWRRANDNRRIQSQTRTWLLMAAIFGGVSAYLFYSQ